MILKKAILIASGLAALAAAAAVCVVALALALFAAVLPAVGPAWAAAIVAGAAALLMLIGALCLLLMANPPKAKAARDQRDVVSRMIDLARERPVIAAGAIIAAGVVAMRNPKIAAALVGAFLAGRPAKK